MRNIKGQLKEIVDEMNYLKTREERFTKANISANDRVQGFAICALTALGVCAYFKRKYLID
ncbi:hypothetical protein EST38_g11117 [Candolleomyces aberdarensis]|uniref:GOLD domain-containing protein n=1 Tax=Candolleomyces aberdarensis TaxID=2316362 RepID=A0A4V1Q2D8_9AGAR|nr:hypothetical protein EST38_g11117 [Candolleomyces aberdarensis]